MKFLPLLLCLIPFVADANIIEKLKTRQVREISACNKFDFVSRREWQGTSVWPVSPYLTLPVKYVIIHDVGKSGRCKDQSECTRELISQYLTDVQYNGLSDIRHNFLIGADGKIYQGRGWRYQGQHSGDSLNTKSVSLAFIGSYNNKNATQELTNVALNFLACSASKGELTSNFSIHAHRHVSCTACPGKALFKQLESWPRYGGKLLDEYVCK